MGRILDLSVFRQETLDITLLDGTTARVGKPSQRMVIEVLKLRNINAKTKPETVIRAMDDLVLGILNSNVDGRAFAAEDLANLTFEMKNAIISAYNAFVIEMQANPT